MLSCIYLLLVRVEKPAKVEVPDNPQQRLIDMGFEEAHNYLCYLLLAPQPMLLERKYYLFTIWNFRGRTNILRGEKMEIMKLEVEVEELRRRRRKKRSMSRSM